MGTRMTWPSLGPRAFVMVVLRCGWVGALQMGKFDGKIRRTGVCWETSVLRHSTDDSAVYQPWVQTYA